MANEFIARKGLIVSGSTIVTNAVTASFFRGDGSNLTNITTTSASFSTTASFATTSSIATSANTLQTTRTIWGRNFNGSSNITGSLFVNATNAEENYFAIQRIFDSGQEARHYLSDTEYRIKYTNDENSSQLALQFINTDTESGGGVSASNHVVTFVSTVPGVSLNLPGTSVVTATTFSGVVTGLAGGTSNYIPLWTSTTAQSSSNIYQSGGNIGIGTTSPASILDVRGSVYVGVNGSDGIMFFRGFNNGVTRILANPGLSTAYNGIRIESNLSNSNGLSNWTLDLGGSDVPNRANTGDSFNISRKPNGGSDTTLFILNSSGNVGIGTTSPNEKVEIAGDLRLQGADANRYFSLGNTYGGIRYTGNVAGNLRLDNASVGGSTSFRVSNISALDTTALFISASGNVGIGTTTPQYRLDVTAADSARFGADVAGDVSIRIGSGSSHRYLQLLNEGGASGLKVGGLLVSDTYAYANPSRNNLVVKGTAGIGVATPTAQLHVSSSNNTIALEIDIGPNASYVFRGNSTSLYTTTFNIDDTALTIGHDSSVRRLQLQTNSTSRLTILGDGNVGIGTTTPGATLHIQGNVSASSYTGSILANNGIVSSSGQVSYTGLSSIPSGIVSGSTASSPSQGTVRVTINGANTDVDTGLQTGDSPSFVTITSTQATGTAPFTVASRTLVTNLNADLLDGLDSTVFASTGSNTFTANQTISGSLTITQNLNVLGSSSISYVSQSTLNIGTNLITVNVQNPSIRFGGLAVIDSGSSPQRSGSLLFDSVNDQWIFVHQNQTSPTSSVVLMGPQTYNNIGNETNLTNNYLLKSVNAEHVGDSQVFDNGTNVGIGTASPAAKLEVNGNVRLSAGANRIISVSAPTSTGDGNNLTIQAGSGTTAGSGGSLYLYAGVGVGGPGPGIVYLGYNGMNSVQIDGYPTINNSGPNNGIGMIVTAGGATSFRIDWDNPNSITTYQLARNARFISASSYSFDNNVGIGTTSPGNKLSLAGGHISLDGTYGIYFNTTGGSSANAFIVHNEGELRLQTLNSTTPIVSMINSVEKMRVHTNGNVGIGTVSPATKLHVAGGAAANQISVGSNTAGETGAIYLYGTSTKYNWSVGAQQTVDNGFEITPSTATGGVSFTSPAFVISGVTRNIGINTSSPNSRLTVNGNANITGSLDVTGAFTAQTKSFKINHQTIPNRSLVYGVLEGPEHAVYVRGRLTDENTIYLPTEWEWLIDENSITVQLTPIGSHQKLYVDSVSNKQIVVKVDTLFDRRIDCYYLVHATRKDVEPLQTVQ